MNKKTQVFFLNIDYKVWREMKNEKKLHIFFYTLNIANCEALNLVEHKPLISEE